MQSIKIITLLTLASIFSVPNTALAYPTISDAYAGGTGCFFLIIIPAIIYFVYKSYGILAGAVSAFVIGALVYIYPEILIIIDGLAALTLIISGFFGGSSNSRYNRY